MAASLSTPIGARPGAERKSNARSGTNVLYWRPWPSLVDPSATVPTPFHSPLSTSPRGAATRLKRHHMLRSNPSSKPTATRTSIRHQPPKAVPHEPRAGAGADGRHPEPDRPHGCATRNPMCRPPPTPAPPSLGHSVPSRPGHTPSAIWTHASGGQGSPPKRSMAPSRACKTWATSTTRPSRTRGWPRAGPTASTARCDCATT